MKDAKIAIIGAGSTYTPELIEGIVNRRESLPVRELALMDIDSRKLNIVGSLAERMVSHAKLSAKVVLTEDYDKALENADFVFVQIRVGKLPARLLDEKIPLKYNLLGQETTGIGGFFKALRTVPVLLDICRRMKQLCPNAWLLNFTNPSGICAQALLDHTDTKALGLCNVPIHMAVSPLHALNIPDGETDYIGLNHLSFVTSVRHNGKDYFREALNGADDILAKLDGQMGYSKEIIKAIEGIPSYYLNYFLHPQKSVQKLLADKKTRAEECMEIEEELLAMYSDANLYVKPEKLSQRGGAMYSEVAMSLAESIFADNNAVHVVNTYNNGAISFMADDDVVETKAVVNASGAKTIKAEVVGGEYIQNIMRTVKTFERLTVKAAVNGSRADAISALLINPLVADYDAATKCFDELLEAHRAYLPQF
ncbi:MAG: 6-phospho-beta-glucosidase [Defluviitaleaceae bacterium]|nr:6-phospho-beta-glucosidase [Defluviitaleaceae bacterium]